MRSKWRLPIGVLAGLATVAGSLLVAIPAQAATGVVINEVESSGGTPGDPDSDDYSGSPTLITVQVTDGLAFALVLLVATGSVSGVASVGSASALFAGSVVVG